MVLCEWNQVTAKSLPSCGLHFPLYPFVHFGIFTFSSACLMYKSLFTKRHNHVNCLYYVYLIIILAGLSLSVVVVCMSLTQHSKYPCICPCTWQCISEATQTTLSDQVRLHGSNLFFMALWAIDSHCNITEFLSDKLEAHGPQSSAVFDIQL